MSTISGVLFVDIETVSGRRYLMNSEGKTDDEIYDALYHMYDKRYSKQVQIGQTITEHYEKNAALYAEFGRIINITVGNYRKLKDNSHAFFVKSMCSRDEAKILTDFAEVLDAIKPEAICAHNGIDFDYPYIHRRTLINGLPAVDMLDMFGKNKWKAMERLHDTKLMFAGTQYNHHASLDLLAHLFGVPSPKAVMNGAMVGEVYWSMFDGVPKEDLPFEKEEAVLKKIGDYGVGDVVTLTKIYCKLIGSTEMDNTPIRILEYGKKEEQ